VSAAINKVQLRLVSFDLDGTILRGRILDYANIPRAMHRKIQEIDNLMDEGKIPYDESLRAEYALFSGMRVNGIAPDPNKLPLINDLKETVERLRNAGVRVVILTDNPSFAAEPLKTHGFQDVIATESEVSNGILTGAARVLANKLVGLREYCNRRGIELSSCAHVGDWTNDIVVFNSVGLSVALNPSEESVSKAATHTVNSDSLLDVYRVLEPNLPAR
jgi:HAD superfamily phosphoserine phosphatase-like hydrolase